MIKYYVQYARNIVAIPFLALGILFTVIAVCIEGDAGRKLGLLDDFIVKSK
jgi:hypothetical protein